MGSSIQVCLLLKNRIFISGFREKKDTRCLTAVSLNLKQKIYPVIWSVKGLPSDAYKLIPAPIAGALVLSMNFISFYSQVNFQSKTGDEGEVE